MNIRRILLVLVAGALLAACSEEPKAPSTRVLVESVDVEGECRENHAVKAGRFAGTIEHWRSTVDDRTWRFGLVYLDEKVDLDNLADLENLYEYELPDSVYIDDIPPDTFARTDMVLDGVSIRDPSTLDNSRSPSYASTCRVRVTKRLDHFTDAPE